VTQPRRHAASKLDADDWVRTDGHGPLAEAFGQGPNPFLGSFWDFHQVQTEHPDFSFGLEKSASSSQTNTIKGLAVAA
jgi:hypothetical protein